MIRQTALIAAAVVIGGLFLGLGISQPWQTDHRPTVVNCAADRDHDCPKGERASEILEAHR